MIRAKREHHEKPVVDLSGPDGNAFVLIGLVSKWCKQFGKENLMLRYGVSPEEIQADMMSGDYEHLLEVIEKYFGDFVILER